jgi:cytidylate kinase
MAIVTIFGGTFGDDERLAKSVAETLGYPYVSREVFVEASRRYGIPEAKLDEIVEKEPHWWERWQENLRPYRIALQATMYEVALGGDIVYCGHVGHGLLPGIQHVLRVLITAPMEFRLEQVRTRQGLDVKAARRYIDRVEKAHTRRLMALFGRDWRDLGQYALVLNIAQMSSAAAVQMIVRAAQLEEYRPTAASQREFADLALATKVQAVLLLTPGLRNLVIDVQAKQGEISLSGLLPPSVSEQEVVSIVESVPDVKKVLSDLVAPKRLARFE